MPNVTINMDARTLRWVRLEAAKAGLSVSRWIGEQLRRLHGNEGEKSAARARIEQFLDTFPGLPLSENGKITIDRDELYDGGRFRRFDHADLHAGQDEPEQESQVRGVAEDS